MIKRVLILALASAVVLSGHSTNAEVMASGQVTASVRANNAAQVGNTPAPTTKATPSYSFDTTTKNSATTTPTTAATPGKKTSTSPAKNSTSPPKTATPGKTTQSPATTKPSSKEGKTPAPTQASNQAKQAGRGALRG